MDLHINFYFQLGNVYVFNRMTGGTLVMMRLLFKPNAAKKKVNRVKMGTNECNGSNLPVAVLTKRNDHQSQ
jgi:hypothetical protein